MPTNNEFGALHSLERQVVGWVGQAKSKLAEWERKIKGNINSFDIKNANLQDAKKFLKIFKDMIPSLLEMEKKSKEEPDIKANYDNTIKLLRDLWGGKFTKYINAIEGLKTQKVKDFHGAADFNLAVKDAENFIEQKIIFETQETLLSQLSDGKNRKIKIIIKGGIK